MMTYHISRHTIMLILFFLVTLNATGELIQSERAKPPETLEEARTKAAEIVGRVHEESKAPGDFRISWATELLCFLDSEDADIRAVAVEEFPKLYGIRFDECIPYLRDERLPLSEQIALLLPCIRGLGRDGERYSSKGGADEIKEIVKRVFSLDVTPPRFAELAAELAVIHRWERHPAAPLPHINELVPEDNKQRIARRFLSVMNKMKAIEHIRWWTDKLSPERLFDMVTALGEEHAGPAIEQWYQIEADPDARRVVVAEKLNDYQKLRWTELPEWKERRKAILTLAANDWDEEIAAKAKELLAEME